MTEYQNCYIFGPEQAESPGQSSQRPEKRRKISKAIDPSIQKHSPQFVPLLSGTENSDNVQNRLELFVRARNVQEKPLYDLLQSSNADAISEIISFIQAVNPTETDGKIPAAFIVAEPRIATDAGLFDSILEHAKLGERIVALNIDSAQTPNLKTALKYINRHTTIRAPDQADKEFTNNYQQGDGHLNYDLQILHSYVQLYSISKVILSFQDSEAFDGSLLMELIDVLSSWNDRIPFVLLFGIATSIDMFQEKMSRATARRLRGVRFDVTQLEIEEIFKAATSLVKPVGPLLGPNLSSAILQRQKDYIQSISTFFQAVQYAHMSHFFANPLSIFLNLQVPQVVLQKKHFEAIRNLPSFQRLVEESIETGDYETAQDLLNDDTFLYQTVQTKIRESRKSLSDTIRALEVISTLQSCLASKTCTPWSELYISGMSGKLQDSPLIKEALLSIRKLPSDAMKETLIKLSPFLIPGLSAILHDLESLAATLTHPLRSSHEIHHKSLRTTVVAQKVELSAHPSALSPQDLEYSTLVTRASDLMHEFFQTSFVNPTDLFAHEILIYDLRSPHRDVFAPNSRSAVERALSAPHDYLGCECCDGLESALSATQPATAVLYQLYLESGALVNVADLWAAFFAIVGKEDCEDEEQEQQRVLALFSRALAELKYMGMIKNSRKKADHISKLLWKGL